MFVDSSVGVLQACAIEVDQRTAIVVIPTPIESSRWDDLWDRTLPTVGERNMVIAMPAHNANAFCEAFSFRAMAVPIIYIILPPKFTVAAPRIKVQLFIFLDFQ